MTGKFLQVKCAKCNNEQNVYSKASNDIKCLVCNEVLGTSTGSAVEFSDKAEVLKAL